MFSKIIDIIAKILAEISQKMGKLRAMVLQNKATIDYLWVKHNFDCQQFPVMCCFHVSDFPHTTKGQICDLRRDKQNLSSDL